MATTELPLTLEEQVIQMKKYVSFRQHRKMRDFLEYAGYFRASRYGKFLLTKVQAAGARFVQQDLFALYQLDVNLRRILNYYCNVTEVRFKSALSNACSIATNDGTFYLNNSYYTPSRGESDAKIRRQNVRYFNNNFFPDILQKEKKLRSDVGKYPELREYRRGGSRQNNKLPVWATFNYTEFGTVTMMYNYLRGDLRKKILKYAFVKVKYSKRDTELMDTWLDAVRNTRNYCAHNSMVVGMTSSVVLREFADDAAVLPQDNDLFSRLYAIKKLLNEKDAENLKKDLKKIIRASSVDIYIMDILPEKWEEMYDGIHSF